MESKMKGNNDEEKFVREIEISKKWLWMISVFLIVIILFGLIYITRPNIFTGMYSTFACGNNKCEQELGENCGTCNRDCSCLSYQKCVDNICETYCGNNRCDSDESKCTCPKDCGSCSGTIGTCKEYYCSGNECLTRTLDNCCGNNKCEIGEDYKSCSSDCPIPMSLGKPTLRDSDLGMETTDGKFIFRESEIYDPKSNGYRVCCINIPIKLNTVVKNIVVNMGCDIPGYGLFGSLKEESTSVYSFESYEYPYASMKKVRGSVYLMSSGIVNSGYSTGTKILSAGPNDNNLAQICFTWFPDDVTQTTTMSCSFSAISETPAYSTTKQFNVQYIKD